MHPDHGSRIDLWSAVLPFNPLVPISSHKSAFLLMTTLFSQDERTVRSFSQTSMNSTSGHASGNFIWTYPSARLSVSLISESLQPTLTTSVEQRLSGSTQSHTLGWRSHANCAEQITLPVLLPCKVNRILSLLRRSMYGCSMEAKKRAYIALVHPHLEYCSPVWNPHLKDWDKLVKVQKRAACWEYCRWDHHGHIHMKRYASTSNLKR